MFPNEELPVNYADLIEIHLWEDVARGLATDVNNSRMRLLEDAILVKERAIAVTDMVDVTDIPMPKTLRPETIGKKE